MFGNVTYRPFMRLALLVLLAAIAPAHAAEDRLPIFDTHVHYSKEAWIAYGPEAVFEKLDAAGVDWALVSSTPDDGTVALHRHDNRRVVPELRPYHADLHAGNWYRSPEIIPYLEERLKNGIYRGIGEFHLHTTENARTPTMRRVAALAVANDIPLHVHSGAGPVAALFEIEPKLKILWAHAGMVEPADVVADLLDQYENLTAEVSFRAHDIAPGGQLSPAWRDLFNRHANRFMIGTDTYINDRWDAYGSLVAEHRNWLEQLPPKTATAIAHGNAARVFGITAPSQ
ncbi:MAG: amidohydrolase [Alphaproteobacteria bacterium]|nr:amidohydrolase [Alphaproteobacteria bacterium]